MAKKQTWHVVLDGEEHVVIYRRPLGRHVIVEIDGEAFQIPRGAREEPFILGGEQAFLSIQKNGKASIRLKDEELCEIK